MINLNRISRAVMIFVGAFAASLTGIQAMAAEEESQFIEEIIVTSTYRETNLMDTPQSIGAVTAQLVEDLGAQSMADIYMMVPGLNMLGDRDGENRYAIRGLTSQTGATGFYPVGAAIGVYLDGTPVTAALGPDNQISGALFDIERVEVLKGPQGTLFGEGSQGGTIRYLYKQPDTTAFDAAVTGSFSSMAETDDHSSRINAMVNIPFGDGFAARLTGWTSKQAGWVDNLEPEEFDYNKGEMTGGRAVVAYEQDTYSLKGSIYHSKQATTGNSATVRAYENASVRIPGLDPGGADETTIYSFIVDIDLDWASFQSMTSYTDRSITALYEFSLESRDVLDFYYGGSSEAGGHPSCNPPNVTGATWCPGGAFGPNGFPGFFNLGVPGATIPDGANLVGLDGFIDSYVNRWVQEFRLVSTADSKLRWTAGFFWKDSEDHSQSQQVGVYFPGRFTNLDGSPGYGARLDTLLKVPANTHTDFLEEFALFGEISYVFNDEWEATLGLRISDLEQTFSNAPEGGTDDTPVAPKFVLSWRPNDNLLTYFNYAVGFRPGNINNHMEFVNTQYLLLIEEAVAQGLPTDVLEATRISALSRRFFDGDEVQQYEVGLKTTLFDGRVSLQTAAYFLDWKDMIMVEEDPLVGATNPLNYYNTNSGGAEISGFEITVTAFLTERLSITVGGDVNDGEVTQGPVFGTNSPKTNELIYAPPWSATLVMDYDIPLSNGWMMSLHADHAWVDVQWTDTRNTLTIDAYQKTNARITLRDPNEKWRVGLFATNLTNEEIVRNRSGASTLYWYQPRQIGLEVGYKM
jgi:outer membrane receptor protein involved in Fe transport